MLTINEKQISAFKALLFEDFVARMVLRLHEIYKELVTETDIELMDKVQFWTNQSLKYGIETSDLIKRYIELAYSDEDLFGLNMPFWIDGILRSDIEPLDKIDILYDRIILNPMSPSEFDSIIKKTKIESTKEFDTIV